MSWLGETSRSWLVCKLVYEENASNEIKEGITNSWYIVKVAKRDFPISSWAISEDDLNGRIWVNENLQKIHRALDKAATNGQVDKIEQISWILGLIRKRENEH